MTFIKRQSLPKDPVACARCGAETLTTEKDPSPLCLICRAFILARSFQARRMAGLSAQTKSGRLG